MSRYKPGRMVTGTTLITGTRLDEVSSAVQKAIRRGTTAELTFWLTEWLRTAECLASEDVSVQRSAKGVLTNLENRINEVITCEDVLGFAQPALLLQVDAAFAAWNAAGRTLQSALPVYSAVHALCLARKYRLPSFARAFYRLRRRDGQLPDEILGIRSTDQALHILGRALSVKDEQLALDTVFRFLEIRAKDAKRHWNTKEPSDDRKVWNMLEHVLVTRREPHSQHRKLLMLLMNRYKADSERKEAFQFLVHAVMLVVHTDKVPTDNEYRILQQPQKYWDDTLLWHRQQTQPEVTPDYVLDMHTSRGRKMGRGALHFLQISSRVDKPDAEFRRPEWELAYSTLKWAEHEAKEKAPVMKKRPREEEEEPSAAAAAASEPKAKRSRNTKKKNSDEEDEHAADQLASLVTYPITAAEIKGYEEGALVGQKLTSKHKPPTRFSTAEGAPVLKGPFANTPAVWRRLYLAVKRAEWIALLGIRAPWVQLCFNAQKQEFWLKMEQLSLVAPINWVAGESIELLEGSGIHGRVVERSSMGFAQGHALTPSFLTANPQVLLDQFMALACKLILEPMVGDCGLWNTLFRSQDSALFSVDMEEIRAPLKEGAEGNWQSLLVPRPMRVADLGIWERVLFGPGSPLVPRWQQFKQKLQENPQVPRSEERIAMLEKFILSPCPPSAAAAVPVAPAAERKTKKEKQPESARQRIERALGQSLRYAACI